MAYRAVVTLIDGAHRGLEVRVGAGLLYAQTGRVICAATLLEACRTGFVADAVPSQT
ncbi:MAG: hypothetical protein OXI38_14345 [Bacteroidota bacterium]|nr:hypothetical protein [Bacteroidota bacterium]